MNKPRKLELGNTIGIISPSGPTSLENIDKLKGIIEAFGFKVKMGKSPYEDIGYLAGPDEVRARDINQMFGDSEVDAILCVRGGYGSPRILDKLDYDLIRANPKIFLGYSDITGLHLAFNKHADLVTFHGPMGSSDMVGGLDGFTKGHLEEVLMKGTEDMVLENPEGEEIVTIKGGIGEGTLIGGNLSLLVDLIGTDYEINAKDSILFIEEVGEEPYNIDRMLCQLKLSGKFKEARGIILGDFNDCESKGKYLGVGLMEVIKDYFEDLDIPVIYNLQAGHCSPMITLPFGVKVRLDADKKEVRILEDSSK